MTPGTYAHFDTTLGRFTVRFFDKEAPTTVGNSVRILILVAVYVLLVFFGGLPLILLAVLGIAETFLHLRVRRLRGAPPLT